MQLSTTYQSFSFIDSAEVVVFSLYGLTEDEMTDRLIFSQGTRLTFGFVHLVFVCQQGSNLPSMVRKKEQNKGQKIAGWNLPDTSDITEIDNVYILLAVT